MAAVRRLVVVPGDQLDLKSAAFDDFDVKRDLVWMAEVTGESTYVLSHKVRIAYFLSAMRHFAEEVRKRGFRLEYRALEAAGNRQDLKAELQAAIDEFRPERLVVVEPGEWRIEQMIRQLSAELHVALDILPDRYFYCSRSEFADWAKAHKQLRMEFFYREMRKRTGVLMENGEPVGGRWNFDRENRKSFGREGPGLLLQKHRTFPPCKITADVIALVNARFAEHPGTLEHFALPVTARDAQAALNDFICNRLPYFGDYQDAMWTDEPVLFHSQISAAMNLKLLDPRAVLMQVEDAYHRGHAPLASVEGYVRQILGWREYVRGIYWTYMPRYLEGNALKATEKLPDFYWDGRTDMNCLKQSIGQTLAYGYAHHIQRLMVTGLYALLFGVEPLEVHKWYLAIYWDAVEWVELPNTVGMSQFADGGLMASKPYIASGKYISRMSNYCQCCRYRPSDAIGKYACPYTTLYWDFLIRHEEMLAKNPRTVMQVRNLARLSADRKSQIRKQAAAIRERTPKGAY